MQQQQQQPVSGETQPPRASAPRIRRYDPGQVLQINPQSSPPKEGTFIGRRGSGQSNASSNASSGGKSSSSVSGHSSCHSGCPMYPVSITLLINNSQTIYLEMLPDDEELFIESPAEPDLQHKPLMNGKFEVECVFFTPNECTKHRAGRLVIDNRQVLELGPLSHTLPVNCGILLDKYPSHFRLEVKVTDSPAEHPAETLLARHTLAVLQNDEFFGSVSSSHLQNQVRDLPYYPQVIGPIKKCWTDFIRAHTDKWDIFKYSQEEIDEKGISSTCRSKEFRLVARNLLEDYEEGDIVRDQVRVSAERQLHELLLKKLRERPYEQSELLADLMKEKSFLAIITPNISKLLDYFEAHPDRFFVLRSHLHPILVEAKKEGVLDPKLDAARAQQQQQQQQQQEEEAERQRAAARQSALYWGNTELPSYAFDGDYEG